MPQCCGLFGRLFGHKVRSLLVKSTPVFPPTDPGASALYMGMFSSDLMSVLTNEEYVVVCVRCGTKPNG